MIQDIATHMLAVTLPILIWGLHNLWGNMQAYKHAIDAPTSHSFFDNCPRPKNSPSDYIVYMYDDEGKVEERWVFWDFQPVWPVVNQLKKGIHHGRLFKDGEVLEEW